MRKPSEIFREKLVAAIKSGKVKKSPLSQRASLSRVQLDRYLSGESIPDLDAAREIANQLGMSLTEMIEGEGTHTHMDCLIRVRELFQTIDSDPQKVIRHLLKGRKK